jgi:hypothetical protein
MITIVRSLGERTTERCLAALPGAVLVQGVRPFSETLKECYRIAIASGEDIAVCVDADVIPEPGMTDRVQRIMDETGADAMALSCHDKFSFKRRFVGISVYRISSLDGAIERAAQVTRSKRPERDIRSKIGVQIKDKILSGTHGYDQYYRDIYRSARVWAVKHTGWPRMRILRRWERSRDKDYAVALEGWRHGAKYGAIVDGDMTGFDRAMDKLRIKEKAPL